MIITKKKEIEEVREDDDNDENREMEEEQEVKEDKERRRGRKKNNKETRPSPSPALKRLSKAKIKGRDKIRMPQGVRDIQLFFGNLKMTGGESGEINTYTTKGAISNKFTHKLRTGSDQTGDGLNGGRGGVVEDAQ